MRCNELLHWGMMHSQYRLAYSFDEEIFRYALPRGIRLLGEKAGKLASRRKQLPASYRQCSYRRLAKISSQLQSPAHIKGWSGPSERVVIVRSFFLCDVQEKSSILMAPML